MPRPGLSNANPRVPRAAPRRPMGPDELDPLDAAASPVTPDLDVRREPDPEIQRQRAARHRELMASGMSMEQAAAAMVAEDGARVRAQRQAAEDSAAAAWAAANAPVDPLDEPRTPEELRGMGLFGESEPGPSTVDGTPVRRPEEFGSERQAGGYTTRAPVGRDSTDPATFDFATGRPAAFAPSPRDRDMAARGFEPVYGDDGTVGYSVAAPIGETNPVPGAPGRRGRRADLEGPLMRDGKPVLDKDGNPAPMYEAVPVPGPTGTRYVYRPTDATRQYNADLADEQRTRRQANTAGMSAADMAALDPADRRRVVSDARDARQRQLVDNVRAVGMLTGGQPSWGRGGTGTAAMQLLQLPDDWRNTVLAQRLAPEISGTSPNDVAAQNAAGAMRLLQDERLADLINPDARAARAAAQDARELGLPPATRAALSRRRGEPMGTGLSSEHVNARWDYWMNNMGGSGPAARADGFRREMRRLGYDDNEINDFMRAAGADPTGAPAANPSAPPAGQPADQPPFHSGDMPRPGVGPFDRPGAAPRPFG